MLDVDPWPSATPAQPSPSQEARPTTNNATAAAARPERGDAVACAAGAQRGHRTRLGRRQHHPDGAGPSVASPQPPTASTSASPPAPPRRRASSSSISSSPSSHTTKPAGRGVPQAMVVVAQVTVPPGRGPAAALPLPELLLRLLPEHCPTVSAAKRTLRRRLVLRIPPTTTTTHRSAAPAAAATDASDAPSTFAASRFPPADGATPAPPGQALPGTAADLSAESDPAAAAGRGRAAGAPPHPAGAVLSTTDTVRPGDVLQLLARCGTGFMGWVAGARAAPAAAAGGVCPGPGGGGGAGAGGGHLGGGDGVASLQGMPVAFEDEHLAVVIKPPGIATEGSGPDTVHGRLKFCLRPTNLLGALNRPQQVHRLDAPTGGLLLVAKTHEAMRGLAADLHHRRMSKRYCALVKGERVPESGTIDLPLSGKPCVTSYTVVQQPTTVVPERPAPMAACPTVAAADVMLAEARLMAASKAAEPTPGGAAAAAATAAAPAAATGSGGGGGGGPRQHHAVLTKVLLWPHTGRKHQLRKHLAYTGTPILGDSRYRGPRAPADPRVADGASAPAGFLECSGSWGGGACPPPRVDVGTDSGTGSEGSAAAARGGHRSKGRDHDVEGAGTAAVEGSAASPTGAPPSADSGVDAAAAKASWEVHRPPVDEGWMLAVAAAAAGGDGGDAGDCLADGSPASLCLWAVGLRCQHPITGRRLEVDIGHWADRLYDRVLRRHHAGAATAAEAEAVQGAEAPAEAASWSETGAASHCTTCTQGRTGH